MELNDKVIVITGGTKGLGKALAIDLKKEGANIIICSRNKEEVEKVAKELDVIPFVADVTQEADMQALVEFAINNFKSLDVWVNNAGVSYNFSKEDQFIDVEKAKNILDVNLFGTIFGTRSALKHMTANRTGTILNIISTAALDASRAKNLKIYAASKYAVRGYTEGIRAENLNSGVSIFAVYPGGMQTELWRGKKPDDYERYMTPEYVTEKIIENLKKENPEPDLVVKRPGS